MHHKANEHVSIQHCLTQHSLPNALKNKPLTQTGYLWICAKDCLCMKGLRTSYFYWI